MKRLSQESTWRGLITIAAACGAVISPDLASSIVSVALALVGLINIVKQD
tara:strand:- start:34156 stop:34305 length:150 start_codon:yes stop_codon:yes gene_type:complete